MKYLISVLILSIVAVWIAILGKPTSYLTVIACDVGQGDGFLVQLNNTQVLIDGGPGSKVIDCLSRYMPFWDRTLEVVVLTHPQADHYEGLIEVVRRYNVLTFVGSEVDNSTQGYEVLRKELGVHNIRIINPTPTKDLRVGMIYLDILYPTEARDKFSEDVLGAQTTTEDLNNYSVVLELRYYDFEMLFTGDIGPEIINEVLLSEIDDTDILKVPHHGSKNGLTAKLLDASKPELAVISVGKNNRFGHPSGEIIQMLNDYGIKVLRTDEIGDVRIFTDGKSVWY